MNLTISPPVPAAPAPSLLSDSAQAVGDFSAVLEDVLSGTAQQDGEESTEQPEEAPTPAGEEKRAAPTEESTRRPAAFMPTDTPITKADAALSPAVPPSAHEQESPEEATVTTAEGDEVPPGESQQEAGAPSLGGTEQKLTPPAAAERVKDTAEKQPASEITTPPAEAPTEDMGSAPSVEGTLLAPTTPAAEPATETETEPTDKPAPASPTEPAPPAKPDEHEQQATVPQSGAAPEDKALRAASSGAVVADRPVEQEQTKETPKASRPGRGAAPVSATPSVPAQAPVAQASVPTPPLDSAAPGLNPEQQGKTKLAGATAEGTSVSPAETTVTSNTPPPGVTASTTTSASTATTPTAPAHQAPPPPPLNTQLAKPVFALTEKGPGQHTITLSVTPENLGPVTVRAHISPEGMRIEMFAGNDAAREALKAVLPDLKRDLAGQGVGANVNLSSEDQPGESGARREFQRHQPMRQQFVSEDPVTPAPKNQRMYNGGSSLDVLA